MNIIDSNTQSHGLGTERELPLTVAMAVCNAERYLQSAIENILSQTFTGYELLIIDDGSNDSSVNIIKEFAAKDGRIRYILKDTNEGLSSVRNISIKEAHGKYLMMVDADDLFDLYTIEKALRTAYQNNADVVIWDYDTFYSDEMPSAKTASKLTEIDVNNRHALIYLPAFMPVRMLRTEYARKRGFEFPTGLTKQDIPIHWNIVTDKDANIVILPERLFHYRQHRGATSSRNGRSLFSLAYVMDIVGKDLRDNGLYSEYQKDYLKKRLTLLHGMYDFISPKIKHEAMDLICERLDNDAIQYLSNQISDLPYRTQLFYRAIKGDIKAKIQYHAFLLLRKLKRAIQ